MTPLHTLAQVRLAHNDPGVKKITLARLFLLPSLKKKQSMKAGVDGGKGGVEVLEPILTGPYVRDYYGRKACDLLPPEHQATMRGEEQSTSRTYSSEASFRGHFLN